MAHPPRTRTTLPAGVSVLVVALGATSALGTLLPRDGRTPSGAWVGPVALLVALSTVVPVARAAWRALVLRPLLAWSVLLVILGGALGAWIVEAQPAWGVPLDRVRLAWLAGVLVLFVAPCVPTLTDVERAARALRTERLRRGVAAKLLLALTALVAAFFALETGLRLFCVISDGFAVTAMHRAWHAAHWKPKNALGFRDVEAVAVPDTRRVLVVGDSFVVGHGIEDLEDTFGRVLERELGPEWRVHLAAKPGWATNAELANLDRYPLEPSVVVLSYYINDMGYLLPREEEGFRTPGPGMRWFANGFFSTSYLYWHTFQGGIDRKHAEYAKDRLAHYDDPGLWAQHASDLLLFVEHAQARGARLVVLVWPRLDGVESSRGATSKVSALFRERGVSVLDLTDELADELPADLVVNRLDPHPDRAVHARVGRLLAPLVRGP